MFLIGHNRQDGVLDSAPRLRRADANIVKRADRGFFLIWWRTIGSLHVSIARMRWSAGEYRLTGLWKSVDASSDGVFGLPVGLPRDRPDHLTEEWLDP
ncbi:hypothetical protein [Acidocella sp.]|uniref:hypothetical protein n=1 Tax=Acidocella sp. TaxID=50710 RepID=UPI003D08DADC